MFIECRHIMPSGYKCKSPALRGMAFCYYHTSLRRFQNTLGNNDNEPLLLPSLEDTSGIQIALHQVLGGLACSRMDPRHVSLYLRGLNIAARLAKRPEPSEAAETVHDLYYEDDDVLAHAKEICEIPQDCLQCTKRDDCEDFENSDYEVDELEEESEEEE